MPGGASRTPDDTKSFALPHAPRGIDAATDFVSSGVRPSHAGCVAHRLARMREPDAAFADPRQAPDRPGKEFVVLAQRISPSGGPEIQG